MPARGGGPPNNGQRLSWLIGPASSMAGLAQTAQQWSVRAARSVCGWYHCTPLGGVRKVRTQEKMYTYLYRLVHSWVRKLGGIAQPRSDRAANLLAVYTKRFLATSGLFDTHVYTK